MKKFLLLVALLFFISISQAQHSWKISLNKKTVIASSESDELLNSKKIKPSEWQKTGYLEISFKEKNSNNWLHSFQFNDESGNLLMTKDTVTTVKIPNAEIRKLFKGKKQVKIYMVINPPDPRMMAPSRMLHLGTLSLL
ncbi:MAG: hypothetical protein ACRDEB_02240 [Chitinophagaceae bacterium]